MRTIVIIEDEPSVREELAVLLKNEGYETVLLTEFQNLKKLVMDMMPDLILLDLGLPERDGLSFCMELRRDCNIPIIFVTSRDSVGDELQALSMGGDDYITKPYNVPLLLARIRAVLRRSKGTKETELLEAGGMKLNLSKGTLCANGMTVELTRNEIQIMVCLMNHPGEIVSRPDFIEALWDNQIYIDDNTLSVNMTRLRGKLAGLGLHDCIKTRRGMGYQL